VLDLALFGAGQATYDGRALPGFPHQQPYLLLCYLLINRDQPHPREQLAAVFWGDYSTLASRKYLRNALWRVRQLLQSVGAPADEYLLVDEECVSFSPSGRYSLDVEVFETAVSACHSLAGEELTTGQAARLEQAVQLYTGDLLSDVYQDWCLVERERLLLEYLNTLGKLMVYHEINGSYEQGLTYGRRILACDNLHEAVHREMMRLYWQSGDRSAALAQYKRCAQILDETLGISPLEETTDLYQQMKLGRFVPETWPRHGIVPVPGSAGRAESLPQLLDQALNRLRTLQTSMEQAEAELCYIREQLSRALPGSRQSPKANQRSGEAGQTNLPKDVKSRY
jgi:DNA-binding SARP family transcriptional activator